MKAKTTLKQLIAQHHLTAIVERTGRHAEYRSLRDGSRYRSTFDDWRVTLLWPDLTGDREDREDRSVTLPFHLDDSYAGADPTAHRVLKALLSDAYAYEQAADMETWASELGFDPEDAQTQAMYDQVAELTDQLHEFLGDEFETFLDAPEGD